MWKLATPVLAVVTVLLLIERRQQQRRADSLWNTIVAYRNEKHALVAKLAKAHAEVKSLKDKAETTEAVFESMRSQSYWASRVMTEDRQRIAYLTERNEQLTLNALVDGVKFIKRYTN